MQFYLRKAEDANFRTLSILKYAIVQSEPFFIVVYVDVVVGGGVLPLIVSDVFGVAGGGYLHVGTL